MAILHDFLNDKLRLLDIVDDVQLADFLEVSVECLNQEVNKGVVLVLVLRLARDLLTSSSRSMPTIKYKETYLR